VAHRSQAVRQNRPSAREHSPRTGPAEVHRGGRALSKAPVNRNDSKQTGTGRAPATRGKSQFGSLWGPIGSVASVAALRQSLVPCAHWYVKRRHVKRRTRQVQHDAVPEGPAGESQVAARHRARQGVSLLVVETAPRARPGIVGERGAPRDLSASSARSALGTPLEPSCGLTRAAGARQRSPAILFEDGRQPAGGRPALPSAGDLGPSIATSLLRTELALLVHCGCEAPRGVLRTNKTNSRALGVGAQPPLRARVRVAAGFEAVVRSAEGPCRGGTLPRLGAYLQPIEHWERARITRASRVWPHRSPKHSLLSMIVRYVAF
jgi:hypothetical protein